MFKLVEANKGDDQAGWAFEYNPPMGGAAGEAYTNTLASSGMSPEAVMAREAIQNSVDAWAKGEGKVKVDFIAKSLTHASKASFAHAAGLKAIHQRMDTLKVGDPNCLSTIDNPATPLNLLYIDDYNTTGLAGDPGSPDSKFYKFLLSLGDGGKEHNEHGTGGSYGFGKSVYSSNSGISSIFAYSRTVDDDGNPLSLLFGCGYFRKHRFEEKHFTGRSWFGIDVSSGGAGAQQIVHPLKNQDADEMAAKLGFVTRESGQLGTSVLIVDAQVELAEILHGIEDWWWPRLLSNLLDIRVVDAKGKASLPRPKKREDLKPFIEAYFLATGVSPGNNKSDFLKPLAKYEQLSLGKVGFKILQKADSGEYSVPEERVDSIALIRAPLMVVAYHRQWNVQNPGIVGAFFADGDIDDILRSAEPPAHDRWDAAARRLHDQTGRNRAVVERVLRSIKRSLKQCQETASPPPPPRPKRLTLLERTLANFLTPSKKGPGPQVEASAAPISLSYDQDPRAEALGDKLRLTAKFTVKLKADEDASQLLARVRVSCPVIADGQIGDEIPLRVVSSNPVEEDATRPGWSVLELTQVGTTFECESDPYDSLWTVRFVPEVEPVEVN